MSIGKSVTKWLNTRLTAADKPTPTKPPMTQINTASIKNCCKILPRQRNDCHPYADFFGALGNGHQHDVHHADAADYQWNQGDGGNQQLHRTGGAFDYLPDAVAVVHEEIFRAVPRFEQIGQPFFGNLGIGIVFDFDGDGVGVALACDLVHHRRIGRPKHQRVGIAESVFVFFITPMTVKGRCLNKMVLPSGSESAKSLSLTVWSMTTTCASSFTSFSSNSRPFPASVRARRNIVRPRHTKKRSGRYCGKSACRRSKSWAWRARIRSLVWRWFLRRLWSGFNPCRCRCRRSRAREDADGVRPIELMSSKFFCEPLPNATTETAEAMPMMMPSIVEANAFCAQPLLTDILGRGCDRAGRNKTTGHLQILPAFACEVAFFSVEMIYAIPDFDDAVGIGGDAGSCVTIMTVCRLRAAYGWFHHVLPLAVSAPSVGSSAKMISPPFIRARAMETRFTVRQFAELVASLLKPNPAEFVATRNALCRAPI